MHLSRPRAGPLLFAMVLALVAGAVLIVSGASPARAATGCGGETPDGMVRVGIVVDFGTRPGAPAGPSVECLVLNGGSTGGDLLRERSSLLGTPRPRYAASGLLCGIDGNPSSGCGETTGGGYLYWSSWSGSGGDWVYTSGNPFTRRLSDGDIVGWRFVLGAGGPQDPPPRAAPDANRIFPSSPSPSSPPTAPPAGGGGGGPGGVDGSGGARSGDTGAAVVVPRHPNDSPGPGAGDDSGAGAGGSDPATTVGSVEAADGGTDPSAAPTPIGGPGTPASPGAEELAAQSDPSTSTSGADALPGLIVGVVIVAGLGSAALVRYRRSTGR